MSEPLACPRCATRHALDERFCSVCGMPLVYAGRAEEEPLTEAHERARKVKPQYTRGELVRVASGRNQAEAELIQGLLLEEGIPSVQKRTRGFDVPDFLAAGPRDIMVPEAAREAAREALSITPAREQGPGFENAGVPPAHRLLAGILIAVALAAALVWLVDLAFQGTF